MTLAKESSSSLRAKDKVSVIVAKPIKLDDTTTTIAAILAYQATQPA